MFLPSLLEYTTHNLHKKLLHISNDQDKFRILTKITDDFLHLHLDFVMPQFAKDRSVMTGLSLTSVFDKLQIVFPKTKLSLSIHLMGTLEDLVEAYGFWQSYIPNPHWKYLIFTPEKYFQTWNQSSFSQLSENTISTGIWYDLNEYSSQTIQESPLECSDYLLMTVQAGKSGQKLQDTSKTLTLELANQFPNKNFIVDGGWSVDEIVDIKNLDIVSYSSFWKKYVQSELV